MDKYSSKKNCLDLIRLIAAVQVLFNHSVENLELSINTTIYDVTFFFRGVPIFFCISGFLIWFSMEKSGGGCKNLFKKKILENIS